MSSIPEVSGTQDKRQLDEPSCSGEPPLKKIKQDLHRYINSPVLTGTFVDPESKQRKVMVSFQLLTGIRDLHFDVDNGGEGGASLLKISYNWPCIMTDTNKMMKKDDGTLVLQKLHPAVLCLEESLKSKRTNVEDTPAGMIEVQLPEAVCSDPKFWEKFYNKTEDGTVVFLTLLSEDNEYSIQKSQKTLKIN